MKKVIVLVIFILLMGLNSCSKDNNPYSLSGTYTETSPVNERTQIEFKSANRMIINKSPQMGTGDEFIYEINGNSIKLTPTWNTSSSTEFEIEIIGNCKFKIENLYPHIPEASKSFITFEK